MAQSHTYLLKLYEKVRHLAKDCDLEIDSFKKQSPSEVLYTLTLKLIDQLKKRLFSTKTQLQHSILAWSIFAIFAQSLQQEYEKLEKVVQKHEQDIRKHIALQQQLKLYNQSLGQQLEDSQKMRKSTFDETKATILQLKAENNYLFNQNKRLREQLRQSRTIYHPGGDTSQPGSLSKKTKKNNKSICRVNRSVDVDYTPAKLHNRSEEKTDNQRLDTQNYFDQMNKTPCLSQQKYQASTSYAKAQKMLLENGSLLQSRKKNDGGQQDLSRSHKNNKTSSSHKKQEASSQSKGKLSAEKKKRVANEAGRNVGPSNTHKNRPRESERKKHKSKKGLKGSNYLSEKEFRLTENRMFRATKQSERHQKSNS